MEQLMKCKYFALYVLSVVFSFCFTASSLAWERLEGNATAISINPQGDVYILGKKYADGGKAIYKYVNNNWIELPGGGVVIAAGPKNELWTINNQSQIMRFSDHGWQKIAGSATDIAIGDDGSVYSIGTDDCGSGFGIYRFIKPYGWEKIPGCGEKIDVSPEGIPWVVNRQGRIFKFVNGAWLEVPGGAFDIAVGEEDEIWVTGTSFCRGGRRIFHYQATEWLELEGCAVSLDIAPDSGLWVINANGEIFRER